ncbi:MAG: hypothetical protein PVH63_10990 [Balneolaceae bacterium]
MQKISYLILSAFFLLLLKAEAISAQTSVPFDSKMWTINSDAHQLLKYQGKDALYLHNGNAILDGPELKNGIIEFDIAFSGERGFTGVSWRRVDSNNFEYFYVRPHQSGKPDANQYTPVFNGITGWQLYYGDGYAAPIDYPPHHWIHVRIVSWEGQAKIYIDDMNKPAIEVPELKRKPVSGGMGLHTSMTPVYFANFQYQSLDNAPFNRIPMVKREIPDGMVKRWEISKPISEDEVDGSLKINTASFKWQILGSEPTGITNLSRLYKVAEDTNTVLARLKIRSESQQLKRISFGYSDRVRVFVNGRPLYAGDNTYASRDFRYLGTIGLFDDLYLPLEEGENEILFAVSETFGGWGIMVQLKNREGIELIE